MVLPKHIAATLAGTWQLLNQTPTDLNGNPNPPNDLGAHPVGLLQYDARGYMSASITATEPEFLPPNRAPEDPTHDDFALAGQHILAYAGELHLQWDNSTALVGRLTHGPLLMASRPGWLGTIQTRNYIVTRNASETGGKDVLHLWARNETTKSVANIYWARAEPLDGV
ncbi:Lipocalin-like domain-containing protein [Paraphoma chrysanthemicola]|nr:Lipocalin-like domain-containing protein [Paraphoma chrysanthemicola]